MIIHAAVKSAIERSSIKDKEEALNNYLSAVDGQSNTVARAISRDILGEDVYWDWDGKPCNNSWQFIQEASSTSYSGRLLPLHRWS